VIVASVDHVVRWHICFDVLAKPWWLLAVTFSGVQQVAIATTTAAVGSNVVPVSPAFVIIAVAGVSAPTKQMASIFMVLVSLKVSGAEESTLQECHFTLLVELTEFYTI
jgi:hypothetical protein